MRWITLSIVILFPSIAFAAGAGGGGAMPWDAPLTNIETDLSGTTATAIALIAMVGVMGVLIFGGEINHFVRTLCFIVFCASVLVAGNNLFTTLGIAGASVAVLAAANSLIYLCSGIVIGSFLTHLAHRIWERVKAHRARVDALITEPVR